MLPPQCELVGAMPGRRDGTSAADTEQIRSERPTKRPSPAWHQTAHTPAQKAQGRPLTAAHGTPHPGSGRSAHPLVPEKPIIEPCHGQRGPGLDPRALRGWRQRLRWSRRGAAGELVRLFQSSHPKDPTVFLTLIRCPYAGTGLSL